MLLLYQGWQKAKSEGWERSFCERNMLSSPTMEMIVGMRSVGEIYLLKHLQQHILIRRAGHAASVVLRGLYLVGSLKPGERKWANFIAENCHECA